MPKYLHINQVFFNRPIDHQSTSNDRLKPVMTTGLVNMHIDRSIANLAVYRPQASDCSVLQEHNLKSFILSIFEWPLKTGFTVFNKVI